MTTLTRPSRLTSSNAIIVALGVIALVGLVGMAAIPLTGALFTNSQTKDADFGAARIFRDERDTAPFVVNDASSGSGVNRTSPLAVAGDSLYFSTYALPTSFSSTRYVEFDLNSPLPAGLAASSSELTIRLSADSGGATTCYYVEVRRISSGALLSSHGSSGSPLGCVTGTTFAATQTSLSAVSTTDLANDLRIRVYARDSAGGVARVDRVVVTGASPYSSFTLYSLRSRDTHDGQTDVIPWGLAG